ncbi:MAG TPA: hypothetical protein VFG50_02495 [Rhodothermales bacterium]|nr:hypothetical protein [Rhodothermales bacterium]
MKRTGLFLSLVVACLLLASCQTIRQIAQLQNVHFDIDHVSNATLANVPIDRVQSYGDLSALDLARLGAALAQGSLPLSFTLHLGAENPPDNNVQARLVQMDWTLFVQDHETISGTFDQSLLLPPGQRTDVPIPIRLDLVDFFGQNLSDLVELALAVSGHGGEPKDISVEATPTVQTPLGPIRYPRPITIVARSVGG